jgi:hypothetical protein
MALKVGKVELASESNGQMDFVSTSIRPSNTSSIKHVHCWHTDDMFSKFMFGMGKYDGMNFKPQANMTTVRDYIAVVAISSLRVGPVGLGKLASDVNFASRMENWIRVKP